MKKLFLFTALFVAAAFSSCSKHDNVETPVVPEPIVVPEPQPLAIAFAEVNSLQFDVDETKTVHYSITGGSDNTVVKAELKTPNDAYIVETTPTSATEGTITITAKTPETENCIVVTVSDGDRSTTAEIAVSTNPIPEELAITFAEGNSLQFDVDETKTVHYSITGGSDNTVVNAEMQTPDDAYAVEATPTSATEGTIKIMAKVPTENCVLVTVSDGDRSITAEVAVALRASFDGKTVVVVTPGTLAALLADYDKTKITELTVIGNLNDEDIATLKSLPKLAILDMEQVNLEVLPVQAFSDKKLLTSVKLPLILKTIGNWAFGYCSGLTNITIPDSVTSIGVGAFYACSLTSVMIPNGVTSIGSSAFTGCRSLTGELVIPDSVTEIGVGAFTACTGLTAFYGKFASSDNRCLIVDSRLIAFAPVGLTSYTIPDGVTSIGGGAFRSCSSLTSITIPDGVTSIGGEAFFVCSGLTSITIPNSVTEIGYNAFGNCSNLASITIPNSVTSIGEGAFYDCSRLTAFYGKFASSDNRCLIVDDELVAFAPAGLTSYTIPDGVTTIGHSVFFYCSGLTSITIPDGVTEIRSHAFNGCSSLTSITIPDSVTLIWHWAFGSCSGLTSIYCKATIPPSVDVYIFDGVSTKLTLYVPTGCKAAYAAADEWKRFTTIIETQF